MHVLAGAILLYLSAVAPAAPPSSFDLRNVDGTNFTTSVKNQRGGTCWTHGAMAAVEGHLLMSGVWSNIGIAEEPNLAEYHLDWWNGFNEYNNDDTNPPPTGLTVHQGGDYLVTAAYMTRGDGAIYCADANDGDEYDDTWYYSAPDRASTNYRIFYPRHVEWHMAGQNLTNINAIKYALMSNGVVGVCMYWGGGFYSSGSDSHYQPPTDGNDPNHAIAVVGWDDNKSTQAASDGAWLCKNSWGSGWSDNGYFWISYYDKHCGQHNEMGAVVFKDVIEFPYQTVYYHDYHGWRDTHPAQSGFNAYTAVSNACLHGAGFYTTARDVTYTATVYTAFDGTNLTDQMHTQTGRFAEVGYHTLDFDAGVSIYSGQTFYIRLDVSRGGMAFDRTSEIAVLLNPKDLPPDPIPEQTDAFEEYLETMGKAGDSGGTGIFVPSAASPGESYYFDGTNWIDFTQYTNTGNLCIKGLAKADFDMDGMADDEDPDDDNDGAADEWEARYGFDPYDGADGTEDGDGDGADNREEYIAGTVPTNTASCFKTAHTDTASPAEKFILRWPCATGRLYGVERTTNLLGGVWTCLESNIAPVLPDNVHTDYPPAGAHSLFYRIRVRMGEE